MRLKSLLLFVVFALSPLIAFADCQFTSDDPEDPVIHGSCVTGITTATGLYIKSEFTGFFSGVVCVNDRLQADYPIFSFYSSVATWLKEENIQRNYYVCKTALGDDCQPIATDNFSITKDATKPGGYVTTPPTAEFRVNFQPYLAEGSGYVKCTVPMTFFHK